MVLLEFFSDIILPVALWLWGRLSLEQKWVPGVFPGDKGGRCVRLTTLPPSCAFVMISGNLNFLELSGPLQACNGTALPLPLYFHLHLFFQSGLLPTVFPTVNLYGFLSLTLELCAPPISCPWFNYVHNTLQQSPVHIMRDQNHVENMEHFNRLVSTTKNDARCTYEIQSRFAMAKAAFSQKKNLFTRKLHLKLRKKEAKCYIWNVAL